ncbi:MAG: transposase [Chloroflexi bacterium]|nr:transposase [Chloroflexota bacterium]
MRTRKELYQTRPIIYKCELESCPHCEQPLVEMPYLNGLKTVQTMNQVMTIAYRPKSCDHSTCDGQAMRWPSAAWQQIAPKYSTYGYDVIAQIGWERQKSNLRFEAIQQNLSGRIQISEAHVRYQYHQRYLPLLACHERQHLVELQELARRFGLILTMDGLMPEGGEPQLWVVRELLSGRTLRSGWMSCQDEAAFVEFLQPIADLQLRVKAVLSDKQRGLLPAVATVFPKAYHGFCQLHYLDNAAEAVAEADEQMKISLRQGVRAEVGDLIRQKQAEKPLVLTVTGLIPSPTPTPAPVSTAVPLPNTGEDVKQEQEKVVQAILSRVRYLLTLKGRPPFRLAGIEMYARLQEMIACVQELLQHCPEPRLSQLLIGLQRAIQAVHSEYAELSQGAKWLTDLAKALDPEGKPARTGEQVRKEWESSLARIAAEGMASPRLQTFSNKIRKVSQSYAPGLFYTYDIPGLPRTNNARESEFRDLRRRLLSTTGQVGAVKRLLQREGAWKLIPGPSSLPETGAALSQVERYEFLQEQQRVQTHRARFKLHTRSIRQSETQLRKLVQRWKALPHANSP